jgi:hypothetical protein
MGAGIAGHQFGGSMRAMDGACAKAEEAARRMGRRHFMSAEILGIRQVQEVAEGSGLPGVGKFRSCFYDLTPGDVSKKSGIPITKPGCRCCG